MDDFDALKRHIEQTLKIQCGNYKEDYIKRRLLSRMRSTNTTNHGEYLKYLKATPSELEVLRNALTINVTEFFRDNDVYEILRKEILPDLFSKRKRLRIWCAGCSTGEEPYSIAMILHEIMSTNKELSVQILATDIDKVVLAKAQEGIYSPKAMVKLSDAQTHHHFNKLPDGNFQAKPHLKELIRFRPHDLMGGTPVSRWLDLITCRNVTIYFTEKQKDDLARLFHDALVSDGYYIMGKTEYLGRQVENLFVAKNSVQKIFMRKD
ncbi:MAG: protein-glutamate O-methyltransferase CheR [Methanoregula sp.]|uniref:CheR family methyltransferase n=1 Tax=Methanoregula sp. TaxID=2052170 RepID=UPI0025F35A5D|nr:protein-glutamate O-methyltransferase CheR [Methanoregula sp.]MCK9630389.1 protein-glutamate O-methyltransferase CheR [Methanoregula sp.]